MHRAAQLVVLETINQMLDHPAAHIVLLDHIPKLVVPLPALLALLAASRLQLDFHPAQDAQQVHMHRREVVFAHRARWGPIREIVQARVLSVNREGIKT